MTFDRPDASVKTYQTWSVSTPLELIDATSSFEARKLFAKKHKLAVTDCAARVFTTAKPRPICDHDFKPDPKCDLVDVCSKCGDERA